MRLRRELYSLSLSYFEIFGLDARFDLDLQALERSYRNIQSEYHPDRFVTATASEKLESMQVATQANEAYLTLKKSATRAKYLLELQGIQAISETNTAMPIDFLMQQMEWREELEDAKQQKNIEALEALISTLKAEFNRLEADFAQQHDLKKDYTSATDTARKLIFIDKLSSDTRTAIESLDWSITRLTEPLK